MSESRAVREAAGGDEAALERVLREDARRGGYMMGTYVGGLMRLVRGTFGDLLSDQLRGKQYASPYQVRVTVVSQVVEMVGDDLQSPRYVITGEITQRSNQTSRVLEWETEAIQPDERSLREEAEVLAECLDVRVQTIEDDFPYPTHKWQSRLVLICDRLLSDMTWIDHGPDLHITSSDFDDLSPEQRSQVVSGCVSSYRSEGLIGHYLHSGLVHLHPRNT